MQSVSPGSKPQLRINERSASFERKVQYPLRLVVFTILISGSCPPLLRGIPDSPHFLISGHVTTPPVLDTLKADPDHHHQLARGLGLIRKSRLCLYYSKEHLTCSLINYGLKVVAVYLKVDLTTTTNQKPGGLPHILGEMGGGLPSILGGKQRGQRIACKYVAQERRKGSKQLLAEVGEQVW